MILLLLPVILILTFIALWMKNSTKNTKFPPGPLRLPIIGSLLSLGKKPHEKLLQLKNKYGNIVAIYLGTNPGVVLNDINTIKEAFSRKEFQIRPDMEASVVIRGVNNAGVIFKSGKAHEEQRAFVLKTLKNFGMGKNSIEILLIEEMQRLFETFDKQLGIPMVNDELFQLTSVSAVWSITTGEHGKAEDSKFMEMMNNQRKVGTSFNIFTIFLPTLSKLFPNLSGWNQMKKCGLDIYNYVGKTIQEHKNDFKVSEEPKDLIDEYLQKIECTKDTKSSFYGKTGAENLQGVLADILGAGTETVGATLTWFFAVAIYYPEVQHKIRSEIDKVIGKIRLPSLEDRKQLPYIECVIYELLRYSAVIPLGMAHSTTKDVKIEGYVLPKGTVVLPNTYGVLHDSKTWDDPETFKPERFLSDDGTAIDRNVTRNVDVVFGHGKRFCPGEGFAKDELFIFITGLCQRYTIERDPKFHYGKKIETQLGISLVPVPYSIILNKR